MAVVRVVLTPEPVVVQAPSLETMSSSEGAVRDQLWVDRAFSLTARAFAFPVFGQMANVLVALLTPAAMVALAMGLWRIAADLGWAGAFLLAGGFFSHWQVWIALSIGLKMLSSALLAWGSRSGKFSEEN